jgi:putative SOS response-associated peptidase YedK
MPRATACRGISRPPMGNRWFLRGSGRTGTKGDDPLVTVAVVTCPASDWMAETHHREPVSLAPGDWAKWLGEEGKGAAP